MRINYVQLHGEGEQVQDAEILTQIDVHMFRNKCTSFDKGQFAVKMRTHR